ncbi:hypothetical protein Tco_0139258 [Tanacetum coccineum]
MSSLAKNILAIGAENRPPMLEKGGYDTWQSRMWLYIEGRENEKMLLDSIFSEKIRKECNIKAAKIILHGLPNAIYTLVNHKTKAYECWYRVKELMERT